MRVALVANDRFPIAAPFAGGLESFTWHLARTLRERGAQVTVFAAPGSDPGQVRARLAHALSVPGLHHAPVAFLRDAVVPA